MEGEFPEGELVSEEPILVVSFKIGICRVDPKGKDCRTVFQRLSFNGKTSVVRCRPLTGRTHQIRVHLQYLGFPILNDPIYGSSAWGPHRGRGGLVGKSNEELLQALEEEHRSQESLHLLDMPGGGIEQEAEKIQTSEKVHLLAVSSEPNRSEESRQIDTRAPTCGSLSGETADKGSHGCTEPGGNKTSSVRPQVDSSNGNQTGEPTLKSPPDTRDHLCSECKLVRPDPTEKELIMFLHALRYKGPGFEYSTPLPYWAQEDWVEADWS